VVCRFDVKVFNGLGPRRGFVVWRNDAAKRPCRFARYWNTPPLHGAHI